ncbi:endonuclease/exonuclease/phosphatase family protein [Streptomyces peucetius]|uniref:Endonuclease/exonuclease/phosphatase family protein n=1 Tax=Streptomyces peucetius TaxID=1950 RepID=A0ABY6I470_STRPE|nr:endonuclease/exonuclease/phosphatase family protein [Streptomyces peucetius]UYQ61773.1 endonuclease/exonuclease/phosphatase family protein [Streptomyces peucetius]
MAQAYTAETGNGAAGTHTGSFAGRLGGLLPARWREDRGIWRRGVVLALFAVLIALLMALHSRIPNRIGNLGSLTETFLPWLGIFVPLIAVLLPLVVWLDLFGGLLTGKSAAAAHDRGDLTVATHNVNADNPDPAGTAKDVAASGADVLALQELPAGQVAAYEEALSGAYRHHAVEGTVGVWSKYPLTGTAPVDIGMGWVRAMRTTVEVPGGDVAVYVAHMPSVRVKLNAGFTANQRDDSADALGEAIAREREDRIVLLGDLNGTMNDRSLNAVTSQMRSTQGAAGDGFGFSWPAAFPMARIDQIMVRGVEPVSSWTLPRTPSDHLPIAASVTL